MVPLFGAAYAATNKAPHFILIKVSKNTAESSLDGKIQGLLKTLDCFSSTFQGKFYFQGLFKTVLYIQVLFKPVQALNKI